MLLRLAIFIFAFVIVGFESFGSSVPQRAQRTLTVEDKIEQAGAAIQRNDLNGAEKTLREVLKVNPRSVAAYNLLGYVLSRRGSVEEGEKALRKALEIEPSNSAVHINLGNL